MPITGIFFCSCRLCNNCGGRLYQDLKDAQSGWRIFHCLALMITNTMILIGMVFVYLTNDWVGQVVKEVGPATLENIDHIYGYTENINSQLAEVYDSYILVENATESELNNVGNLLGEPIANELKKAFNPAFKELEEFQNQLNAILITLETTDKTLGKLKTDTTNFQGDLETIRDSLKSDLAFPNCGLNTACRSMQINTEFLDISGDYSSVSEMSPFQRALATFFRDIYRQFNEKVSRLQEKRGDILVIFDLNNFEHEWKMFSKSLAIHFGV